MRFSKKSGIVVGLRVFFLLSLLCASFQFSIVAQDGMDSKAKAVYDKISAKIARIESEFKSKEAAVRAKYPADAAERVVEKLELKKERAIERYKEKGNRYFRRRGLPEPWTTDKPPPVPIRKCVDPAPASSSPSSADQPPEYSRSQPVQVMDTTGVPQDGSLGGEEESAGGPDAASGTASSVSASDAAGASSEGGVAARVLMSIVFIGGGLFLTLCAVVLYFLFVRKWPTKGKLACGCGCLVLLAIYAAGGLIAFLLWGSPSDGKGEGNASEPDPLVERAAKALAANDLASVKSVVKDAYVKVESNPNSIEDLMRLAEILVLLDNNEDVNLKLDGVLSRVLELDPDNIKAKRYLADARYRSGLYSSALDILEPLLLQGEWLDRATLGMANLCYLRDERYADGIDFFSDLRRHHPENAYISLNLAVIARHAGRLDMARSVLEEVLAEEKLPAGVRGAAAKLLVVCGGGDRR